jgi:hypothetical protein
MTAHDPIQDLRRELARITPPTAADIEAQRARLDASLLVTDSRTRRQRRWLPASGVAIAGLAVAVLVAIALQPGGADDDRPSRGGGGLQLVREAPHGAFSGLDLESASAADVLRAAGRAAADGVPLPGPDDWTYTRTESRNPEFPTQVMERWTSPDGERSLSVMTVNITDPEQGRVGRSYSLHYENLGEEQLGDVTWLEQTDGTYERRADWHDGAGDGSGEIARIAKLTRLLRDTHSADDVRHALDRSIEGAHLEFRDGMACGTDPKYSSCSSSGFVPQADGLDANESRRLYLTGMLLSVTVSSVFPPDATRAIYDYLATLPEASVAAAADDSNEVILSLRVKGPSFITERKWSKQNGVYYESRPIPGSKFNTKAVAAIDARTGRFVELGPKPGLTDMSIRYTKFGIASGPGVGSEICDAFPRPCDEAREFEQRRASDPKAQFDGVVDWMFISQYCDGMINRDGTPRKGNHMPPSMSKDPKVQAAREACEQREAASSQGR